MMSEENDFKLSIGRNIARNWISICGGNPLDLSLDDIAHEHYLLVGCDTDDAKMLMAHFLATGERIEE